MRFYFWDDEDFFVSVQDVLEGLSVRVVDVNLESSYVFFYCFVFFGNSRICVFFG